MTITGHTPGGLAPLGSRPSSVEADPPPTPQGEPGRSQGTPRRLSGGEGGGSAPPLACQYRNNSNSLARVQERGRLLYVAACAAKAWTLVTWKRDDPSKWVMRRFRCRSWRHEGDCRLWKGAQDFVRCREAISSRPGWVYVVLTFDPKRWPGGPFEAFSGSGKSWNRLRSNLTRRYGKLDYLQTWEATKKGWPHVNILIHNPKILSMDWREFRQDLKRRAVQAGFGEVLWVEPVRDKEAMAGYLTKLARELVGAVRKDQVPVNAPRHFRRIRASRGLLPKVFKNADYTGVLLQKPLELVEADHELLLRLQGKTDSLCHHGGDGGGLLHDATDDLELDQGWAASDVGRGQQGEARTLHDPLGSSQRHALPRDGDVATSRLLTIVNRYGSITIDGQTDSDGEVSPVRERGSRGEAQGDGLQRPPSCDPRDDRPGARSRLEKAMVPDTG